MFWALWVKAGRPSDEGLSGGRSKNVINTFFWPAGIFHELLHSVQLEGTVQGHGQGDVLSEASVPRPYSPF